MSVLYDVAVIGAGPAGSYAASLLAQAGHRVVVLEQRRADALKPRCTGVVGLPYVDLLHVDDDIILARASSATFLGPYGAAMRVSTPHEQACVLDRALLEKRLRLRSVADGVELYEGVMVSRIERTADAVVLTGRCGGAVLTFDVRMLVLAAGVSPALSRQAGIAPPGRYLVGAHAEVTMDGVCETEVHFLPDLAPGAFAWLVPFGDGRVRVGVLGPHSAAALTRRFLGRPGVVERVVAQPDAVMPRPAPVSVPRRTHADRVVALGDSAGQVKPTTGGGLYFGACAAGAAADVIGTALAADDLSSRALRDYERRWKAALGREMRHGAMAREIYRRLSPAQVDRVIARADRTNLADELLRSRSFSFDRHGATLLRGLLSCVPGLLGGGAAEEVRR